MISRERLKNNEQGMTLIEVMISSLVMLIAILGSYSMYVSQVQMEGKTNKKLQSRTLMDQVISQVSSAPQFFPRIKRTSSEMAYVACLSMDGIQDKAINGGSNYNGFFLKDINSFVSTICYVSATDKASCSQKICALPGVEVHMRYTDFYEAEITLLELTGSSVTSPKIQNMYRSTFLINAHLSVPYDDVISPP